VAGFLVAGVYAVGMLRGRRDRYHRIGFLVAFTVAAIAMPVQLFVGDWVARQVYDQQPVKFAAEELIFTTQRHAPETVGGVLADGKVRYGIKIPGLASLLADFSTHTRVQGLSSVPARDRPPANVVHLAFDVMVGIAFALLALSAWFALAWWRRRELPSTRWFLRATALAGAAAVVAMEAGWVVTEVGRQPWVVYRLLRTKDAVTHADGVWVSLVGVVVLYAAVGAAAVFVLRGMAKRWRSADQTADQTGGPTREADDLAVPYGPGPELGA
jgi:cytochrome bd ubiquinol oxidase subunit I